jgi:VanZ family protein
MSRPEPAFPAPRFLNRWQVWAVLMAVLLFPFFMKIPRSLNHHPVISPIGDQVHIFIFGAICLLIYWFGPLRGRIWQAAIISTVMGGAVEFLQLLVGRQALFTDFLLDLVGIGVVTGFVLWKGHGRREGKWVLILLLISIPLQLYHVPFRIAATYRVRAMFPVLANFESYSERYLWSSNMDSDIAFEMISDAPDGESRVLRLTGGPETNWPGAYMRRFPEDWSAYTTVKVDIRVADAPGDSVKFGLRLDDYEGIREVSWVHEIFYATRQWQTFTMRIADRLLYNKKRNLNIQEMDRLLIYLPRPQEMMTLEIDNVRVE